MFSHKGNGNDKCYISWFCEIRDLNILCSTFYVSYSLAPQCITSRARASESWTDGLRRIKHQRNNDSHHIER